MTATPDAEPDGIRARALESVRVPATFLLWSGVLGLVVMGTAVVMTAVVMAQTARERGFGGHVGFVVAMVAALACALGLPIVEIVGGLSLLRLRSYPLAMAGAVCATLNFFCSLVGVPLGIWGLVTLHKPDVREAFVRR